VGNLNLILTFKLAGDAVPHVKGAARISLNSAGGLTVFDARDGAASTLDLKTLQSFSLISVADARPQRIAC
jgi:hypothetical protein